MKICHPIQSISLAAVMFLYILPLQAAPPITLPSTPLYLAAGIAPNLVITLDDSGSMAWAYVPDAMAKNAAVDDGCTNTLFTFYDGSETKRYFLSGDHNAQYYKPTTSYPLPLKADGTPFATSFKAAYTNGFDIASTPVNLASDYQPTFGFQPQSSQCYAKHPDIDTASDLSKIFSSAEVKAPAYYYTYKTGGSGCTGASISTTNEACYIHTPVTVAEQQNFAIWYSFYRTRNLATVSAATRAFNKLPSTMRLAWQSLNSCDDFSSATCKGWDDVSKDHRIRTLSTSHKQNFYDWLVKLPANGGTPLRAGLGRVGEYFSTASSATELNSPYAENPQVSVGTQHSCRANYTIMMTDGMWNGGAAGNASATGNVDNTGITLPDGIAYTPVSPFTDSNSGSLADVAFYYWAKDLRTDLTNNVVRNPSSLDKLIEDGKSIPLADYIDPKQDPASWQHMVTYTVGLGLTTTFPTLTPALTWDGDTHKGSYADLVSGTLAWPVTGANLPGNVADLWHTALNGRGLFFSAEDPKTLTDGMEKIVNNIVGRSSSASAIAASSRRLDTGTQIFQASFDSGDWTGELEAFELKTGKTLTGDAVLGTSKWKASTKIPAVRNIRTFNGSAGVDFAWSSLSAGGPQQTALGSKDVLDYLRGDQTKEQSKVGGIFRTRTSLLGDIVNSDPLHVSVDNFGYDRLSGTEGTLYVTYLDAKTSKTAVIYAGANDGMLHAFRASDGVELFAYVPGLIFNKLADLSKPSYVHQYYVDGAPTMGDVYYGGSAWKTVLVAPLGAGGRGVFALNISTPDTFSDTDVLWEFDGANAAATSTVNDMGYPVGAVSIGRFNDGKYYAVFGNGYGSANCRSSLFMVQVDDSSKVKFFDTNSGDCLTSTSQNGLSTPSLVDYDGDLIIDAIFAGDLLGNVWKFDVSTTTWSIALSGKPLFTATGKSITAPINVGPAPAAATAKAMIYFGTGRYLLDGDEKDKAVQTFYGLLDNGGEVVATKLEAQTIVYQEATKGVRVMSTNSVNWATKQGWFLNLVPPSKVAEGERVLSAPLLRHGRVIFNTSIPSPDPCLFAGTGYLMQLDAATGGNLSYSSFDINGDGLFNAVDYVTYTDSTGKSVKAAVGGKKTGSMSFDAPTPVSAGATDHLISSDIKKDIDIISILGGGKPRSSWRQLQ